MGSGSSSHKGMMPEIRYSQTMEPITTWMPVCKSVPIAQEEKPKETPVGVLPVGVDIGPDPVQITGLEPLVFETLVSIIILCWNNLKYTKNCIASIRKNTKFNYQLVIVDNGSTDGTSRYVETLLNDADILVRNGRNMGFSSGNNIGARVAGGEYLLFLNNDCEVHSDWLEQMIKVSEDAGLVGASLAFLEKNDMKKSLDYRGGCNNESEPMSYLEGWCLLVRKKDFFSLGGFDIQFDPFLCEDSDLSFRCREAGLKIKVVPNLSLVHYGSKSLEMLKNVQTISDLNSQKMYKKWIETGRVTNLDQTRILVRRRGAAGDVLLSTPILKEIKKKYPNSYVFFETSCPDLLRGNPCVNRIVNVSSEKCDFVLDLSYEKPFHGNYINEMAETAGVLVQDRRLVLSIPDEVVDWAASFVGEKNGGLIAVHTGRSWKSREWPSDKFGSVMSHFLDRKYSFLEFGDRNTMFLGIGKDCRGISIKQSAALIKLCDAFLGIDSLPIHLAAAVETPAVVIYGCTNPDNVWSAGVHYPVWLSDLECRGCRHRIGGTYVDCQRGDYACLNGISVQMVINALECCLSENQRHLQIVS